MASLSVLRQSAAEVLAAVVVDLFPGALLVEGAATEFGFYYDFIAEQPIDDHALPFIEEKMRALIKQNLEVRVIDMMRENAAQYLEHHGQPIKAAEVRAVRENIVALFQLDKFCDFCPLPYIAETQEVGAFKLLQVEETTHYFPKRGHVPVKRIHGAAAADKADLKKLLKAREAGRKCDYRKFAAEMKFFSHQHDISDRALIWEHNGAVFKDALVSFWRAEHVEQQYLMASSPTLVKESLIRKSGIYDLFPNQFHQVSCTIDGTDYVVPPSLTPVHAALFRANQHSYRELPVRYAECAQIVPGAKTGRLRGMLHSDLVTADFAHTFCDFEHLEMELISSLQFIDKMIKMFGFEYYWCFVGQGQSFAGTKSLWEKSTRSFAEAFQKCGMDFAVAQQEFAFSGPFAEVHCIDRLGREWKGPKIGLDFSIPERFGLRYQGADDGLHIPLLLVRTIFGSIERFAALLIENFSGCLPLWLAPEQIRIVPVKEENNAYAEKVGKVLRHSGFRVGINCRNEQLGRKVHSAESERVPYALVLGEKEESHDQVTVRSCTGDEHQQTMTIEELIQKLNLEVSSKCFRKDG